MTGPKGNSESWFPGTLIEVEGRNKTHSFPRGQPLSVLFSSQLKTRKICEKIVCLTSVATFLRSTTWSRVSRKFMLYRCFPREVVRFNPRHVTRFPPTGKRIWVATRDPDLDCKPLQNQFSPAVVLSFSARYPKRYCKAPTVEILKLNSKELPKSGCKSA